MFASRDLAMLSSGKKGKTQKANFILEGPVWWRKTLKHFALERTNKAMS